jgi:peptidoglycan/xylan/chitin deacetylase (PgdA/CDA1 family)
MWLHEGRVGAAPAKIVFRVIALSACALVLVLALARAAWLGDGITRWTAAAMLLLLFSVGGYLAWIYLPDVDLPGRSPRRGLPSPDGKVRVALTFDDGPNGADTAAILDALRTHGAHATFFVVGEAARRHPELVRRMVAEGHVVGSHTADHRKLAWLSAADVARQLDGATTAIVEAGAPTPRWFRAPHGFKSPFLPSALRQRDLHMVAWSHGVWDTDRPGAEVIAERAIGCLSDGEILLLHDGTSGADRSQTAAALPSILSAAARRGVTFVTVPEILAPQGHDGR